MNGLIELFETEIHQAFEALPIHSVLETLQKWFPEKADDLADILEIGYDEELYEYYLEDKSSCLRFYAHSDKNFLTISFRTGGSARFSGRRPVDKQDVIAVLTERWVNSTK